MNTGHEPGAAGRGAERGARRPAPPNNGGSPVGSPLTIILAAVAVIVGFLVIRTIDSGGSIDAGGPNGPGGAPTTTVAAGNNPGGTAAPTTAAPTTQPPQQGRVTAGADVIVINTGEIGGSAGHVSGLLEEAGYSMVDPPVSDADDTQQKTTVVMFSSGANAAEQVAKSVAKDLGGVDTKATADPAADVTLSGDESFGTATVFVLLGTDKAEITALAPEAPANQPVPEVSGDNTDNADG